jgi:hypothetical protein
MAFNNGPKLVTQGLNLLVDAGDPTSYPGTGTTWRDVVGGQNGIITGSVSYTSSFYGGLVFSGPTASVIFPTSSANFGTGSFTVELAFRPARIEGIHYLVSKNSGSFPNWGIYLSGSGGQGKLFSFFNVSSTVSCSVSSSSTFVTGSNYDVTVKLAPRFSGSAIFVDGNGSGITTGNGGGSLTSTGSLLIGNIAPSSSQAYSGSLYNTKIYSISSLVQPVQNYNAIAPRLSKPPLVATTPVLELLVVAGGGGGGAYQGGGGGAGGLQYFPNYTPSVGVSQVIVGDGGLSLTTAFSGTGANGQNSSIGTVVSLGGGGGGTAATSGGSGGGGGRSGPTPGPGTVGQGNGGGSGSLNLSGGGGGGAGTAGSDSPGGSLAGNGGSGSYIASFTAIGGSPAGWFAGGGGGIRDDVPDSGLGGIGGGGNAFRSGSVNTGGGSGGNYTSPAVRGGSGIVAIRYSGAPVGLGGEITQSAGFTYHVFRTVGTSSFTIF